MLGIAGVDVLDVLVSLAIAAALVIAAFILFYFFWSKRFVFYVPKADADLKEQFPPTRSPHHRFDTFWGYIGHLTKLLIHLDSEYWIKHTSLESYGLLLFQRMMFFMFVLYGFTHMIIFGAYYLALFNRATGAEFGESIETRDQFQNTSDSYTYVNLIIINVMVLGTLFLVRRALQTAFVDCLKLNPRFAEQYWLASRTVEVMGNIF